MGEAYCDKKVAAYFIPSDPTVEDIAVLLTQLRLHEPATYQASYEGDEDSEGNWYSRIEFTVTKRFYEGSPEYAEWLAEKEAAELLKKMQQTRNEQQRKLAEQQKAREKDTDYWNYIYHRTPEMRMMEEKYGPCPRWVGYVPTYTKEACGVGADPAALPDLGVDPDSWGK